jgi:hypothetical protein
MKMQNQGNVLLEIQTSDSTKIVVTSDLFPFDDADIELQCYSILEGYNPTYLSDCWHRNLMGVINLIEFPPRYVSCKRDYISWWLNCKPLLVAEIVKPILAEKLKYYHLTGEIMNAFRYANLGLEFNPDCLFLWHQLLEVEYDQSLLDLIPVEQQVELNRDMITIYFDGFQPQLYRSLSVNLDWFSNFQFFLDFIYSLIKDSVPVYSYADNWILYNSTAGYILRKRESSENNSLLSTGIKANDRIICYKKGVSDIPFRSFLSYFSSLN